MPIKETSDTLDPSAVATTHIVVPPARRTAGDYVALATATCGVGLLPIAPGTWGSLVGVALFAAFNYASNLFLMNEPSWLGGAGGEPLLNLATGMVRALFIRISALLILIAVVTFLGIWAATKTEILIGRKDPGIVVIDEVAGQLITFLFVPWDAPLWALAAGFVLFRLFDIWKPYPVRRLEALESGLGIMADDVLAGCYAAVVLSLVGSIKMLI